MSAPTNLPRLRRARLALAVCLALGTAPASAQAAPVLLETASPFVVLGGETATNSGASVLNGALGVSPGTALPGFESAVVNGATHANDAVAAGAQADLTIAYNTAAAQPSTADLTGTDLGDAGTLTAGVYSFSSSAGLTGDLVLDADGDPDAQFVFNIVSTLTTASNSSVTLINGASPCNVFWRVGSSATIGTTTAFKGNVMALASITMQTGATLQGRALAREGAVTLDTNVIDGSMCGTSSTPPPGTTPAPGPASPPAPDTVPTPVSNPQTPPASGTTVPTKKGTAKLVRTPLQPGLPGQPARPGRPGGPCTDGFKATVRGRQIKRVVFRLDGKRIGARSGSPFQVVVRATPGAHTVRARVTFKDATAARTMTMRYRACAARSLQPGPGPSPFTG